MADTTQKENIMGIQELSKLILFTGIPLIITMGMACGDTVLVISAGLQGLSMGMSSMILIMARQAVWPLILEERV